MKNTLNTLMALATILMVTSCGSATPTYPPSMDTQIAHYYDSYYAGGLPIDMRDRLIKAEVDLAESMRHPNNATRITKHSTK